MKTRYTAVVESGEYIDDLGELRARFEERIACGHLHRTPNAAWHCGLRLERISPALWRGFRIHDQDGHRR